MTSLYCLQKNIRPWNRRCQRRIKHRIRRQLTRRLCARVSETKALSPPNRGVEAVNIVHKFGGSSLANAERIQHVAEILCGFPGQYPLVVLSAMGDTTNLLIECGEAALRTSADGIGSLMLLSKLQERHLEAAEKLNVDAFTKAAVSNLLDELKQLLTGISMMQELTPRAKDAIVSFGERLSTRLFSGYLNARHVPSTQFDAWRLGFTSNDTFTNADILMEKTVPSVRAVVRALEGEIPVVTGYLAKGDKSGAITTLGRGGSDLTATVIGLALNLPEVQVWKDVDGVLTSDPRIVPTARPLPELTYDEASELANFGAQVLHPRAMQPAMLSDGMAVRVKNSYNPDAEGTVIRSKRDLSETLLTSIVIKRGISVVDIVSTQMVGQYGFLARVFELFKDNGVSVDVVATSEISVSISLDVDRYMGRALKGDIRSLLLQFEGWADVSLRKGLSIISLICNIQKSSEILELVFRCLRQEGINVKMISQGASKTNISFVVDEDQADKAVMAIHNQFF